MEKSKQNSRSKHGGNRQGAGRPKIAQPKQSISLRLHPEVIAWIDSQPENRAQVIEKLVRSRKDEQLDMFN
ncbi:hypothetical protein L0668_03345 [Paraglaciecola aquimarina]|uniref:CopG family transcriptional regulator n=1 Tax=Paraglaciecola algarum TaxID=3050085 RepID=A0ABS9D2H6_9ALTE|nr:hypothetical protein [Paraglaciecola sp. G1-23]MCF2947127.1 hypothetical protein [Paraglaciecola sp. G1-23]